jgi:hypothetical protein
MLTKALWTSVRRTICLRAVTQLASRAEWMDAQTVAD